MPLIRRREFLTATAAGVLSQAAPAPAGQATAGSANVQLQSRTVQFVSDGLGLTPAEQALLLAQLTEQTAVEVDYYSRGGAVERL